MQGQLQDMCIEVKMFRRFSNIRKQGCADSQVERGIIKSVLTGYIWMKEGTEFYCAIFRDSNYNMKASQPQQIIFKMHFSAKTTHFGFQQINFCHSCSQAGSCSFNHFYHYRNQSKMTSLSSHESQWQKKISKMLSPLASRLVCNPQKHHMPFISSYLEFFHGVSTQEYVFPTHFLFFARGIYELISCQFCAQSYFHLY